LSGTTHVRVRNADNDRFPALFTFAWSINDVVLQLLGVAAPAEQGNGINYHSTCANPQSRVRWPLPLSPSAIILGEVRLRRVGATDPSDAQIA
jgi:hypothetical protein